VTAEPPPCPGCGAAVPFNPRYPGRFCDTCLRDRATDHTGAALAFVEDLRAAIGWQRKGGADWTPAPSVRCLIAGQPAVVHEARFGGIVAVPADSPTLTHQRFETDLTRPT